MRVNPEGKERKKGPRKELQDGNESCEMSLREGRRRRGRRGGDVGRLRLLYRGYKVHIVRCRTTPWQRSYRRGGEEEGCGQCCAWLGHASSAGPEEETQ